MALEPRTFTYVPHDAATVLTVSPFELYSDRDRTHLVSSLTNGTRNPDDSWTFSAVEQDGTYYIKATTTYPGPATEVDDNDLVTVISAASPRWSYTYAPRLGGRSYDPEINGGQVVSLLLTDPQTGDFVYEVGSAKRLGYGLYQFDVPSVVPAGTYFGAVTWRPTDLETAYVDEDKVVEFPARKNTLIKPWVTLDEVYKYNSSLKKIDPSVLYDALIAATEALYLMSGKKYRGVQVYSEVYVPQCITPSHTRKTYRCTCDQGIYLRQKPVQKIYEISYLNGGQIVPSTSYAPISNMNHIHGHCLMHQALRITYAAGVEPTQLAKIACIALAGELGLSYLGDESCQLSPYTQSVNRNGISYDLTMLHDSLEKQMIGIYEVDLFLTAVNPGKATSRTRIISPKQMKAKSNTIVQASRIVATQPLTVVSGEATDFNYYWREFNTPQPLNGKYIPRAYVGSVDVSAYVTLEPNCQIGLISLHIPDSITSQFNDGDGWYLELVNSITGQSHRFVTGQVRRLY